MSAYRSFVNENRDAVIADLQQRAQSWRNMASVLQSEDLRRKYIAVAEFYEDCAEAVGRV